MQGLTELSWFIKGSQSLVRGILLLSRKLIDGEERSLRLETVLLCFRRGRGRSVSLGNSLQELIL